MCRAELSPLLIDAPYWSTGAAPYQRLDGVDSEELVLPLAWSYLENWPWWRGAGKEGALESWPHPTPANTYTQESWLLPSPQQTRRVISLMAGVQEDWPPKPPGQSGRSGFGGMGAEPVLPLTCSIPGVGKIVTSFDWAEWES